MSETQCALWMFGNLAEGAWIILVAVAAYCFGRAQGEKHGKQ